MKLSPSQTDEDSLAQLAAEAVNLVESRNFSALAERFGYALAFGRDVEQAIKEDFEQCLNESEKPSTKNSKSIQVKYFQPNEIPLFALVECTTPISDSLSVSIDLVVAGDDEKYMTLEGISYVA